MNLRILAKSEKCTFVFIRLKHYPYEGNMVSDLEFLYASICRIRRGSVGSWEL
jgi:hypothetical protein